MLWDITGYSIHEDFRPCSVREQIESGIKKEGYYGELSIWVYGAEDAWSSELDSIFWDSGFETYRYKGCLKKTIYLFLQLLTILSSYYSRGEDKYQTSHVSS